MVLQNRSLLDQELSDLRDNVLRLGSLVETALDQAMVALYDLNTELARQVIAGDDQLNLVRYQIEQGALRVLATQQPAARDLRTVITAIHVAIELERMGDHAAGIAQLVRRLINEPPLPMPARLLKMARRARQMVRESLDAYVAHDANMAQALIKHDDKVDKHYRKLFQEIVVTMQDDTLIRPATYLLWAGHNLERIGDRATNIAERVIFMVSGRYVEIDTAVE